MTEEQFEKAEQIKARKEHVIDIYDFIIAVRDWGRDVIIKDSVAAQNIVLDDDDIAMILDAIHKEIDDLDNDFGRI